MVTALTLTTSLAAENASAVAQTSPTPTGAATPAVQPVSERPDRVSAALAARLQGSRVLVSGETTETTLTYANPDGTTTLEASSGPVRVKRGESWAPIDTSLVAADGVLKPKATLANVTFSAGGGGKPLAVLERSDTQSYVLTWPTPLPAPKVEGNKAIYSDAAGPGADLVVTALPTGFSHDVVLRERPSAPVEYKIPIQTKGLTLAKTKQGGLELTDAKGTTVAAAPEPVMYETSTAPTTEQPAPPAPSRGEIDAQVVTDGDQQLLVLRPDAEFLADPATNYPVTVDPTTTLSVLSDTTLTSPTAGSVGDSGYGNPGGEELVIGQGDSASGSTTKRHFDRSLLRFNTSSLAGKAITDAKLELHTGDYNWGCESGLSIKAQRITSSWTASSTVWSNQPTTTTSGEQRAQEPGPCTDDFDIPAGTWTWQITDIAKAWAQGSPGYGVMLRLTEEWPTEFERQYTRSFHSSEKTGAGAQPPKLVVTYGSAPSLDQLRATPIASEGGVIYASTTTPALHAFVKDPDGGVLRAEFEVGHDPATTGQGSGLIWSGAVDGVQAGTSAKITVPSGKLTDGWKVRWRARAFDGAEHSAWSAWQLLAIDASPPQQPAIQCPVPANGWVSYINPDEPYTCIAGSSSGDVSGYWWGLDDPTTPHLNTGQAGQPLGHIMMNRPVGWHTLYVKTRDKAHNTSQAAAYSFGIGAGGFLSPKEDSRTQQSVTLATTAPPGRTSVRYEWYDVWWYPIPASDVTPPGSSTPISGWPQSRTDTSKNFADLIWNVAKTVQDQRGQVKVRACFSGGTVAEDCTEPITFTLDTSAFGGSYATADIGPGTVALQSGDFSLTSTDASLFGISVNRTLTTLRPTSQYEAGVFGPGWKDSFPATPSWVSEYTPSGDGASDSLQLIGPNGASLTYVKNGSSFGGVGDAADGTRISTSGEQLIVTDSSGSKTTYTKVHDSWLIARTETTAAESAVNYYRDINGRVTRILAPVPTGVTCGTTLVTGCRALEISYATATTATGVASGWGDFKEQVKTVSFTAFDPESNAMKTTVLATYLYDSTGHLRQATDPRTNLATLYYYNGEGRLSQITPPGLAPWRMEYDTKGRLAHVQREEGDVDPTQAVVYDVPITGAGAPVDLSAPQTAKWGQATNLPVTSTALFPPSHPPARGSDGAYAATTTDWEYASLIYTDVNGRPVNDASFGAGAWQVNTSRHDHNGRVVWTLNAVNRAHALAPTADTDPYVAGRADSAERAQLLAYAGTYDDDGNLLESRGPTHPVKLASGAVVSARPTSKNTYDEGKPSSDIVYGLLTRTVMQPLVMDGTAEPGATDKRTLVLGYDPVSSGDPSGWTLRAATSRTVAIDGGTDIVSKTRYDAAGRVIEARMPESGGADAGTMVTTYYKADGSGPVGCRNAAWAGLPCQNAPKAQPGSGEPLPVTLVAHYTYWGKDALSTDTAGDVVRTLTKRYDTAGRLLGEQVSATPAAEAGRPVPETVTTYDPATGLVTKVTAGSVSTSTNYDTFGRLASYTDADGNTATRTYNLDGQVATASDGKGSTTYTYNGTDEQGRKERRGLPTAVDTPGVGIFRASYGENGQVTRQVYPNGLLAEYRYDSVGNRNLLAYSRNQTSWLSFTATVGPFNTVAEATSPLSRQAFGYDAAGRLVSVADTVSGSCASRLYTYTANSNRSRVDSYAPASDGSCSKAGTPNSVSYSYDQADRLIAPGYVHDALGRATAVPAAHVAGGSDLTVGYHVNDMVASLTQAGVTRSFTLDPEGRVRSTTQSGGAKPGTTLNHYSGPGDSPAWISEADGTWTRNVQGLTGGLAAIQHASGAVVFQLGNLHGDIVATVDGSASASGVTAYFEQTEFGAQRTGNGHTPERYGWLGSAQRASEDVGGLVLMGARLYNPADGRFLQTDPVPGASANAYDYCNADPVNCRDLDGRVPFVLPLVALGLEALITALIGTAVVLAATIVAYECFKTKCVAEMAKLGSITVPFPNKDSATAKRYGNTAYIVYEIQGAWGQTYKYGISRQAGLRRPNSQLTACDNYYGAAGTCSTIVLHRVTGWFAARTLEASLIWNHVLMYGACPPGNKPPRCT
ncbi:DNRLRE domain-containing protein [Nonomuraea coxensis]|uniref:DNRLRE domain-containing protein n=1 Tax=Nonomuraea coxensis TaxID=404386 RepID=UPI001C5E2A1B|nr:DNRLRE domain-containing protein [Nonomuraea coxensis]